MPVRKWWKETIIYQIYPRSFKDSNGDGVGDLQGIISKLDYIASLGIGTVWLNPIFPSPNKDNGYDISDYRAIMPEQGTMDDFDRLLSALHARGMRLILDLVVNHTSSQHFWFRQARTSRNNPYYNYYHWWPSEQGDPPHRESFFDPEGKGWHFNQETDSWYLHYFSRDQPDLNWENKIVRNEIHDIMRWWLNKGLDGFRMDAITFISKDTGFPVITQNQIRDKYRNEWSHYYASGPHLHKYLREIRKKVLPAYDALMLAEGPGIPCENANLFVDENRKELDMFTHFEGIGIGYVPGKFKKIDPAGYDVSAFRDLYSRWSAVFDHAGWCTIYLGNHDQPRMVSRWGNDSAAYRAVSEKMLICFLLSMRATPFIYNGDEIGMTNIRFKKIEDYKDLETKQMYERIRTSGGDAAGFLEDQQETARDNSRTPFQWTAAHHAGFTSGTPWISINKNYPLVNAAREENQKNSILNFFRKMAALRNRHETLVYGTYTVLETKSGVYAYLREWKKERLLVILNFSKKKTGFLPAVPLLPFTDVMINNYRTIKRDDHGILLSPYQAVILKAV